MFHEFRKLPSQYRVLTVFALSLFATLLAMSAWPSATALANSFNLNIQKNEPIQYQSPQTRQPQQAAVHYNSVVLSDFTDVAELGGKYYILEDPTFNLTLPQVQAMIRSGEMKKYLYKSSFYNMGFEGKAAWVVIPVSSISTYSTWKFEFGTQADGRYSLLKSFVLYNMNTRQYIYNTDSSSQPTDLVPESFGFNLPPKNTTFLILYVRSSPGISTILAPRLLNPRLQTPVDFWSRWLIAALSLTGFFTLLALYRSTGNVSFIFISLIWGLTFIRQLFVTNFLYISFFDSDLYLPLIWSMSSFLMLAALWTSPRMKDDLPPSLIMGAAGLFMISTVTGLILIRPMANISVFLIYGPVAASCILVALSTWPFIIIGKRKGLLPLALVSIFLGAMIIWNAFLDFGLITPHSSYLQASKILESLAILSSLLFSSRIKDPDALPGKLIVTTPSFEDDGTGQDTTPLKEAKELSEYKRLIQVLEKERQNMSEMQLQAARQTEEMRKAKEEADEANRAKSAFLAIVSHEIRTPMTGIMGMVRLLQDTQLTKDQREYTSTIKDSGDAMLALLNDILDYEKIENGKMELEIINCDIKQLVRSIHTLMSGHATSKGVNLDLEVDSSIPQWVKCDPTRLRQVLLNLINNAIKFTSKGTVYLRIRNLSSDDTLSKGIYQLYFAVQDSGIGIGPEAQKKLFMPFAQADKSISRKYGGTGLGLAICKRLIENMGGGISISSKENEGSTFFFTLDLPAGEALSEEDISQEAAIPDASNFTKQLSILVVDDNGINQKVVSGFIHKLGGHSLSASNAHDALDMIARDNFDMILMDIELPGMSGIEATQKIRSLTLEYKALTPVVALSGNVADEDIAAYQKAGMNDFAPKPVTLEKIYELMLKADGQEPFAWVPQHSIKDNDPETQSAVQKVEQQVSALPDDLSGDPSLSVQPSDFSGFETVSDLGETVPQLSDTVPPSSFEADLPTGDAENPSAENADLIDTDVSFLGENLNLDEDEEDSFSLAVRQFEERERKQKLEEETPLDPNDDSLKAFGLDETMLLSLTSGLPAEVMDDILVGFYEKADELISAVGVAYQDGKADELRARAHELKGMAGNFGFKAVSQLCASIEAAAKAGNIQEAADPTNHLGEKYAMSRARLARWLEEKK